MATHQIDVRITIKILCPMNTTRKCIESNGNCSHQRVGPVHFKCRSHALAESFKYIYDPKSIYIEIMSLKFIEIKNGAEWKIFRCCLKITNENLRSNGFDCRTIHTIDTFTASAIRCSWQRDKMYASRLNEFKCVLRGEKYECCNSNHEYETKKN